ncbi:MAG: hypothetical protein IJD43_11620 [Thermoguttaceae bacterium]|nr:hypothetical protein [Thermoguttaceae bacterium]
MAQKLEINPIKGELKIVQETQFRAETAFQLWDPEETGCPAVRRTSVH